MSFHHLGCALALSGINKPFLRMVLNVTEPRYEIAHTDYISYDKKVRIYR